MEKLDLTKKYKVCYQAKATVEEVTIEDAGYLAVEGKGDPSAPEFSKNVEALYGIAYTIKFMCKDKGLDFVVPKLEAQWWYDELKYVALTPEESALKVPRSEWQYQLMIRMPDWVSNEIFDEGADKAFAKKGNEKMKDVKLIRFEPGRCVQILHTGPFSDEPNSLVKISQYMDLHSLVKNGRHHEVYLSDFNKVEEAKLKTILRELVVEK